MASGTVERNSRWIDAVQKDYLPAEEYNAWILEKEQKKNKKKLREFTQLLMIKGRYLG